MSLATAHAAPQHGISAMKCTNPASGASWKINIDFERNTVDSHPARISEGEIRWHDPNDNGNYTLDRTTGNLTVVVASSTGGAFFYDRCAPEN
jgi:hypothetical protein